MARYYTSRLGRWLSADWSAVPAPVPYANLTNPQTLNLYAMVSDNPETFADLDGHTCGTLDGSETVGCASPANSALPGEGFASPNGAGTDNSSTQGAQGVTAKEQADEQHATQNPNNSLSGPYIADLKSPRIAPLLDPNHVPSKSDVVGNGECVSACKKFAGLDGTTTSQWRAGAKVANNRDIKPGTAIATFDSRGRYPSGHDKNSGIYLGQGSNGSIWILDQWPAQGSRPVHPPQPREVLFDAKRAASDNSAAYYVIMVVR